MRETLRTVILQEIRARFPGINWGLGSLVRELVVEPLSRLGDVLEGYIQKAERGMDIAAICQSPAEYQEELDTWVNRLGITLPADSNSTGSVCILSENPEYMAIPSGTIFSWGDEVTLEVTEDSQWGGNTGTPYKKLSEGAYMAEVRVRTQSTSSATLTENTPLNWLEAPPHVYDIYTGSPIVGGYDGASPQLKANMVQAVLTPQAFTGESCIAAALRKQFPADIIDAKTGMRDAESPATVTLFIKPSKAPAVYTRTATVTLDSAGATSVTIPGAGVMMVEEAVDAYGCSCPIIAKDITGIMGDSNSSIKLTIAAVKPGDMITVRLRGFSIYETCAKWLNSDVQGLPFTYLLKLPTVAEVSVFLNVTEEVSNVVKTAVQDYINDKPLNAELSDGEMTALLSTQGAVVGGAHAYTIAMTNDEGRSSITTTVGGVSPAGSIWTYGRPVAMYSFYNRISSNV